VLLLIDNKIEQTIHNWSIYFKVRRKNMKNDCLFCKIINKEISADFVMETESLVAFKDINPKADVHLLIVPKKHIRSLNQIEQEDEKILSELMFAAKELAVMNKIDKSGYRVQVNVEKGGGQEVFHLHMHLIGNL